MKIIVIQDEDGHLHALEYNLENLYKLCLNLYEIGEIEECPDMEDSSEETYLEIFEEECYINRYRVDIVELKDWDFPINPLE